MLIVLTVDFYGFVIFDIDIVKCSLRMGCKH